MTSETQLKTQAVAGHTPAPWVLDEREGFINILATDGFPIAAVEFSEPEVNEYDRPEEDRANAHRIVAAVNACEGVPAEALKVKLVPSLLAALAEIKGYCETADAWRGKYKDQDARNLVAWIEGRVSEALKECCASEGGVV